MTSLLLLVDQWSFVFLFLLFTNEENRLKDDAQLNKIDQDQSILFYSLQQIVHCHIMWPVPRTKHTKNQIPNVFQDQLNWAFTGVQRNFIEQTVIDAKMHLAVSRFEQIVPLKWLITMLLIFFYMWIIYKILLSYYKITFVENQNQTKNTFQRHFWFRWRQNAQKCFSNFEFCV